MNEDYKLCPYCHNMVDKKDKKCPYCLKSLSWRNSAWSYNNNTRNNSINSSTSTDNYNTDNYNSNTIRDDKQAKKDWELPPFFQRFLDLQKAGKAWDKEASKKVVKYIIIFYLLIQLIPVIIKTIESIFWD